MFRKTFCLIVFCLIISLMLIAETVYINPTASAGVNFNVVDSSDDYTIIEVNINSYTRETVKIDGEEYFLIGVQSSGVTLDKGLPTLPIVARSIIIGADSKMEIEVLKSQFTEFAGKIAPSKGNLYRNVNPDDIPYTFDDIYQKDAFYPQAQARLTDPYVMREYRGIAVQVLPVTVNPVQETIRLYTHLTIKVYANGKDYNETTLSEQPRRITDSFLDIYKDHFINFDQHITRYPPITEIGSMLVICYPDFMTAMQPFVDWKNQKGIPTSMMDATLAGNNGNAIKTWIANYYNSNPSTAYILLVGDSALLPFINYNAGGWPPSAGPQDPSYAFIVGGTNDLYPDLLIARISAQTVEHVTTQVNKTIHYERDLEIYDSWIPNATGIASAETIRGDMNETDEQHVILIRNNLLAYGYEIVDAIYERLGSTASMVTNAVNSGRSYINYTGHGSVTTWVAPTYTTSHVNQLVNNNMLPFIISVACENGKFDAPQVCFAEAWMRATNNTTGEPTGAVSAFMCSILQAWSPPMRTQDKVVELLTTGQYSSISALVYNGQSAMLDAYNTNDGREVMRTWILFGDPSLQIRTKTPEELEVQAENSIYFGTTEYTVDAGIEGALVCLSRTDYYEIVAAGYTDETGQISFDISDIAEEDCPLLLTVTAFDKVTFIQELVRGNMPPPEQVTLVSPEDNATEVSVNPELQWLRPGDVLGYRVYLSQDEVPYDSENPENNLIITIEDTPAEPVEVTYIIPEEHPLEYETTYYWQVVAYNIVGDAEPSLAFCFTTERDLSDLDETLTPKATALKANYPNPFNPTTIIAFDLNKDSHVSISVYDIRGRLVANLVNAPYKSGHHNVAWNGQDSSGKAVASGVYFYRMNAGEYVGVRKMVLLK